MCDRCSGELEEENLELIVPVPALVLPEVPNN